MCKAKELKEGDYIVHDGETYLVRRIRVIGIFMFVDTELSTLVFKPNDPVTKKEDV